MSLIFLRINTAVGKKPEKYQIIIPKDLRETVLQHCHDSIVGGHFGMWKTLEK